MVTDIREYCRLFYQTYSIPVHFYSECGDFFSFPLIFGDNSVFTGMIPEFYSFPPGFSSERRSPDYFITPAFSYFGIIDLVHDDGVLIVGPVFSTPCSDLTVRHFMKEWSVSPKATPDITQMLSTLPPVSFHQFISILVYLEYCINDRKIDINDYLGLNEQMDADALSKDHSECVYEARENMNYHNTWDFERKMLNMIQNGETDNLRRLLEESANLNTGVMAENALRQRKNILITAIALVTRSAILGGMNMEEAYQLADLYIMDCERSQSISYISGLEYSMLIDFSEKVSLSRIPEGMSRDVFECIQYIRANVNMPLQTIDVAEHMGLSRSWLSTRFKKETGIDLSEYITKCKMEEAKSLLTNTDKSLSEISTYLCFSSQSYFQNVFRKRYGITPKKYRDQSWQGR